MRLTGAQRIANKVHRWTSQRLCMKVVIYNKGRRIFGVGGTAQGKVKVVLLLMPLVF
jgi:hypothetical protein